MGEFPCSQQRTKVKLSSRSTNDLKGFVLNEPKMSPATRLDDVRNLATIDRRQEMPVHVETTAVTINQGRGTSNKFVRNLLPRPLHLRLSKASLFDLSLIHISEPTRPY